MEVDRGFTPFMETETWIPDNFTLEVSSPGIYRQLTTAKHFMAVVNEEITVNLNKKVDEEKYPDYPKALRNNLKIKVIYNKWASSWHLGRCEQLMPNKWLLDNAAQELMEKEKIIHEAENNIKIQTLTINRQITEISTIINSCSWKLTAPLRWLLIIIKRKNKKTSAH